MNTESLKQQIYSFLTQLKEKHIYTSSDDINRKDIEILKKQLQSFELIIKQIIPLPDSQIWKISYALKENNQEKEHPSHWFAIKYDNSKVTLISRFTYLKAKAYKEDWRTIALDNVTFYFDYNVKKALDESTTQTTIEYIRKTAKRFGETIPSNINYFVCDSKESMLSLGFNHTTSDAKNIISPTGFDAYEIVKMFSAIINDDASEFLRDGFAVFCSKFLSGGNDTFDFSSRDISPMAKEIIFNAPYASVKKCIRNQRYEDIVNTLFFFSVVYAGKTKNIDYNLILLSPPTSFMKFLIKENSLIDISEDNAISAIIELLKISDYKTLKKEFKKHFKYSLGKYNRHWKKYLKSK